MVDGDLAVALLCSDECLGGS